MITSIVLSGILAILIGIVLGGIGGGGSIITLPVLVYIMHINTVTATSYSLFIVGISSMIGTYKYIRKDLVLYKIAVLFAIPSFMSVYITRLWIVPSLPDIWLTSDWLNINKDTGLLLLFAGLMLLAARSMIIECKTCADDIKEEQENYTTPLSLNYPLIMIEGLVVGVLTGMVGAGGGFLIIPALVLLAKIPMKYAVGTSLLIISVKSMVGFIGDLQSNIAINWSFLVSFTAFAILGIIIGSYINDKMDGKILKRIFGWFVLIIAVAILIKEIFI